MSKSLGVNRKDVIGQNLIELLPPNVAKKRLRYALEVIQTKKPVNFEDERDGRFFKNMIFPVIDENKNVIQIATITFEITEDKKKEKQKLKDQEEYFVSLIENSSDVILVVNKKGMIRYINKSVTGHFGYEFDEVMGKNLFEFVHPDDLSKLKKEYDNIIKNSKYISNPIEGRILHKNGSWIYTESTGVSLLNNPSINGVIVNTRNINERKKAELKLIENEEKLRMISDQSLMGIGIIQDNKIKYLNDTITSILGYSKQEMYDSGAAIIKKIIHPEDLEFVLSQLNKKLSGDEDVIPQYNIRIKPKKGDFKWVEIYSKTITYEGRNADFITFVDITGKKKAEDALKESEEKWRSLVENAPESQRIAIIDKNGKVLFVNRVSKSRSLNDVIGKNMYDFLPKESHYQIKQKLKNVFEKGIPQKYEFNISTPDGDSAYYETGVAPIKSKDGVKSAISLSVDISNIRKAGQIVRSKQDYLQKVIDSASEIIFTVDSNLRIKTWNKTAEKISGYRKKQIVKKSLKNLNIFDNSNDLINYINANIDGKPSLLKEISLNTAFGFKRLLSVSPSKIISEEKETFELLFICRDITQEKEKHGKLNYGSTYLIEDYENASSINIFKGLIKNDKPGLFIGRFNENFIRTSFIDVNPEIYLLSTTYRKDFKVIENFEDLNKIVKDFTSKNLKSIILIDRLDYLISKFSFDHFLKEIYKINNIVETNNSILLIRFNPSIIDVKQLAIIREECKRLPTQQLENIYIDESLFDILRFIRNENNRNVSASYSKVGKEFNLSKVTVQKRLESLLEKGLILTKKEGRSKMLYITDKGNNLILQREII
jgi:PAS domain S-box-containing protein